MVSPCRSTGGLRTPPAHRGGGGGPVHAGALRGGQSQAVFSLSGVTITCMSDVGGGRHLKMRASRDGRTVDMIFFSVTRAKSGLTVGDRPTWPSTPRSTSTGAPAPCSSTWWTCAPAYSAQQLNEQALYRKYSRGEPLSPAEARMMIPQREEFAAVWRYLANRDGEVVEVPPAWPGRWPRRGTCGSPPCTP